MSATALRPFAFRVVDSYAPARFAASREPIYAAVLFVSKIPAAGTPDTTTSETSSSARLSSAILDARFIASLRKHTVQYSPAAPTGRPLRILVCLLMSAAHKPTGVSCIELLQLQQILYQADAVNLSYALTTAPSVAALKSKVLSPPAVPVHASEHLPAIEPRKSIDNNDPPDVHALIRLLPVSARAGGTRSAVLLSDANVKLLMDSYTSLRAIAQAIQSGTLPPALTAAAGLAVAPMRPPPGFTPASAVHRQQQQQQSSSSSQIPVLSNSNPYKTRGRNTHPFFRKSGASPRRGGKAGASARGGASGARGARGGRGGYARYPRKQ